jgi:hypothetical protein
MHPQSEDTMTPAGTNTNGHSLGDGEASHGLRCVVSWLDGKTGVFHFAWCEQNKNDAATAVHQTSASLPFVDPFSLAAAAQGQVHGSFGSALAGTSVPAHLVTLYSKTNPFAEPSEPLRQALGCAGSGSSTLLKHGPFARAARSLGAGPDRRILQMAVQYLANGGLDDSLLAAEYDLKFLEGVRQDLEAKKREPSA